MNKHSNPTHFSAKMCKQAYIREIIHPNLSYFTSRATLTLVSYYRQRFQIKIIKLSFLIILQYNK